MWVSLMGLYEYDNTILDPLQTSVISFMSLTQYDGLMKRLLVETAELELVYPSPNTMKIAVGAWAKSRKSQWQKTFEALSVQYAPAENYDRQETWTDSGNSASSHRVQGFNSTGFVPANDDNGTASNTHTGRVHGNIGVTTNQQMLTSELEFRKYDFYESIIAEFKKMFCVGVY